MASFTAQVKDELSRVEGECSQCKYAQLSAIVRICGTLSFRGPGRYAVHISTETGAVARAMIKLTHELFDLETSLTVRQSVLHKTRNYLIEIGEQEQLEPDLIRLGILVPGRGLARGIPSKLLDNTCCRSSFLRGAFMAGGFIADPRGDFHLEIAVTGEQLAQDVVDLLAGFGVHARLNHRRGAYAVYVKSFDGVVSTLRAMGGTLSAKAVEVVRRMKHNKNNANRQTNADMANLRRTANAAGSQMILVDKVYRLPEYRSLSPALREFCTLRTQNPELSLAQLGELCNPPASKSAMYHRVLRLQALVAEHEDQAKT